MCFQSLNDCISFNSGYGMEGSGGNSPPRGGERAQVCVSVQTMAQDDKRTCGRSAGDADPSVNT